MTDTVTTAVAVEVFPDEFKPILKLLNRALLNHEFLQEFTEKEVNTLYTFKDDFADVALEFAE